MKHTIHKIIPAWQHEKEEQWLNEMSAKGLQLINVGIFKYVFDEDSNSQYTYRLELLAHWPSHAESTAYIRFLEDTGIEHVANFGRWVYFRKKTSDGAFDLYSDNISKIKHYWRIISLIIIVGAMNFFQMPNTLLRFWDDKSPAMIILFAVQLLIVIIFTFGSVSIYKKIRRLKKNSKLSE